MAGLAALQGAVSGVSSMLNNIGSAFKSIGEQISKFINNVKETAKKVEEAFGTAWSVVKEKWNASVVEPLQPFFDFMSESISSIGGWFTDTYSTAESAFKTLLQDPWTHFSNFVLSIGEGIMAKWNQAMEGIGKGWETTTSTIGAMWETYVTSPLGKFWDWLSGKGSEALDFMGGIWEGIGNAWNTYVTDPIGGAFDWLVGAASGFASSVMDINKPVIDGVSGITNAIGGIGGGISGAVGAVGSFLGFSQGGIASGPSSGYPAMLHGTEAIVPLPNGRSIPVEMSGGGGHSFNMTFNLSGLTDRSDKRQFARDIGNMVQQEVARSLGTTTMRGRY